MQWIIEPFRKASLSFALVIVPFAVMFYGIFFKLPFIRTNAIAALRGEYINGVGFPSNPWNDIVSQLAVLILIYAFLYWLALRTVSVQPGRWIFLYRITVGFVLTLISTVVFLAALLSASFSTWSFDNDLGLGVPPIGLDLDIMLVMIIIVLLMNSDRVFFLARDSAK